MTNYLPNLPEGRDGHDALSVEREPEMNVSPLNVKQFGQLGRAYANAQLIIRLHRQGKRIIRRACCDPKNKKMSQADWYRAMGMLKASGGVVSTSGVRDGYEFVLSYDALRVRLNEYRKTVILLLNMNQHVEWLEVKRAVPKKDAH